MKFTYPKQCLCFLWRFTTFISLAINKVSTFIPWCRFPRKEKFILSMKEMPRIGMHQPQSMCHCRYYLYVSRIKFMYLTICKPQVCGKMQVSPRWIASKISEIHWKVNENLNLLKPLYTCFFIITDLDAVIKPTYVRVLNIHILVLLLSVW